MRRNPLRTELTEASLCTRVILRRLFPYCVYERSACINPRLGADMGEDVLEIRWRALRTRVGVGAGRTLGGMGHIYCNTGASPARRTQLMT